MESFKYSAVIKSPRTVIWEVFEDPVASILTLFYEYKDARAEDTRVVNFIEEGSKEKITVTITKRSTNEEKSELVTRFSSASLGEIKVNMKLSDGAETKSSTKFEFNVDLSKMGNQSWRQSFAHDMNDR